MWQSRVENKQFPIMVVDTALEPALEFDMLLIRLFGDLTSSACVCGCVVNGVSATAAT